MRKIIAIGGGELKDLETLAIDREILRLTGKKKPKALFIPTASGDPPEYVDTFNQVYGDELGCKTDALLLVREEPSLAEIRGKILGSDLVYVGGGNTLNMLNLWREQGVDRILKQAMGKGIVMSGLSAGGICWFRYGGSDSEIETKNTLIRVDGLGFVNAAFSPHHIREPTRNRQFKTIMAETPGIGLAMDDNCAIEIIGDEYRFITSKRGVGAHRVYNSRGKVYSKPVEIHSEFRPLQELLTK
jgi:dipeptidase E